MSPEAKLKLHNKEKNIVYDYEYFRQDDVCRLCWNKNAITDIFNENINKIPEKNFANKIKACLEIDITENLYPKKLCAYCCQQIEKFYVFKGFCQETDKKLQEIVKKYLESSVGEHTEVVKTETDLKETEIKLFIEIDGIVHNSDASEDDTKPENLIKFKRCKRRTPTYCNICRIDLQDTSNFVKHNSEYHGIENGLFQCFGCEKKFKNRKTRLSHEYNFCKGLTDGYKCTSCSRLLPNRRHYEAHMRNHRENVSIDLPEDIFKCKHCFKLFKTKDELNKHILEHGGGKKNFVCEKCGRVFKRQDYLYKHKLTHTGEKHHVCSHCNFRTTQRSSLVVHIRKHTGERPYSCDVCPQRCVSSSNLRAHRRRHLGIKQHECTICGKRFGYKVTLAEHVCAAHAPAPQPCPLCAARYTRPRALVRHMRAKHPQQQQVQQDSQLVQQDSQLVQQDSQLVQQDSQLVRHNSHPVHNNSQQHDSQLVQHDTQLVQHNSQLVQRNSQPVQRNLKPVQHNSQLVPHNSQLVQHNSQPVQHDSQLVQRDQHVQQIPVSPDDLQEQDAT